MFSFLRHNYIADMPGPQFLLLFVISLIIAHLICRQWRQMCDPTIGQSPPLIPQTPDPYEIAFLRGGPHEVTRLAALNLIQRGSLRISEEKSFKTFKLSSHQPARLERVPSAVAGNLLPAEEALFQAARMPLDAVSLFGETGVSSQINRHFRSVQARLEQQQLLTTAELRNSITNCNWWAGGVLIALGGYKLADALIEGRNNIWFLVFLLVAVPLSFIPARAPRLTAKGRAYLRQLQNAFYGLRLSRGSRALNANASDDTLTTLMLAGAIFGATALPGTAFTDYNRMFAKAQPSQSGGCGGSVGGSGCGGGCGGGGCGGCGGCGGG